MQLDISCMICKKDKQPLLPPREKSWFKIESVQKNLQPQPKYTSFVNSLPNMSARSNKKKNAMLNTLIQRLSIFKQLQPRFTISSFKNYNLTGCKFFTLVIILQLLYSFFLKKNLFSSNVFKFFA